MTFSTQVFGKVIIAGEHSVLRGGIALVVPFYGRSLNLEFQEGGDHLHISTEGELGAELKLVTSGVVDRALELCHRSRNALKGEIRIHNTIPIGGGVGASAALCVSIGRLIQHLGWIKSEHSIHEFCRQLENLFHGESSGIDVAVALANSALCFKRGFEPQALEFSWTPWLCLSYSGQRGITLDCVRKVNELFVREPEKYKNIDERMTSAVNMACHALFESNEELGIGRLAHAVTQASQCFEAWDLIPETVRNHMLELKKWGALASKPTGSGGGGYVLSLWKEKVQLPQMMPVLDSHYLKRGGEV